MLFDTPKNKTELEFGTVISKGDKKVKVALNSGGTAFAQADRSILGSIEPGHSVVIGYLGAAKTEAYVLSWSVDLIGERETDAIVL